MTPVYVAFFAREGCSMAIYRETFQQMEARINTWVAESNLEITFQGKVQNRACWSAGNRLLCLTNLDKNTVRLEWWNYSNSSPNDEAREAMSTLANIINNLVGVGEITQTTWPGEFDRIANRTINSLDNGVAFVGEMGNMQYADGQYFFDYIPPTDIYDKDKYERWERRRMTTQAEAVNEFLSGSNEKEADKLTHDGKSQERSSIWRQARYKRFQKIRTQHPELTYRRIADMATEAVYDAIEDQLRSQDPDIRGDKLESEKQRIFCESHNLGRTEFSENDVKNDFRKFGKHNF